MHHGIQVTFQGVVEMQPSMVICDDCIMYMAMTVCCHHGLQETVGHHSLHDIDVRGASVLLGRADSVSSWQRSGDMVFTPHIGLTGFIYMSPARSRFWVFRRGCFVRRGFVECVWFGMRFSSCIWLPLDHGTSNFSTNLSSSEAQRTRSPVFP